MKRILSLIIGVLFVSMSQAQDHEQHRIDFANQFIKVVSNHDRNGVIKLMDKDYRKAQIKLLGRNKVQFVDELFSGNDILSENWANLNLLDIQKIEIAEVEESEDGWIYVFRVRDGKHDVICSLLLVKKGEKYGFIGASG